MTQNKNRPETESRPAESEPLQHKTDTEIQSLDKTKQRGRSQAFVTQNKTDTETEAKPAESEPLQHLTDTNQAFLTKNKKDKETETKPV